MAQSLRPRRIVRRGEDVAQRQQRFLAHHIPAIWQRQSAGPTPSRGLSNNGNQCYRNSILQVLFHTPKVVNWLERHDPHCPLVNCITCSLSRLCLRYWDVPLDQARIDNSIGDLAVKMRRSQNFRLPPWNWQSQQHARIFFTTLLQSIARRDILAGQILAGIFGFDIVTESACLNCGAVEHFHTRNQNSLCLPLPQHADLTPITLPHLLSNLTSGYFDTVRSARYCGSCHQRAANMQFARFATAPETLVLELDRFARVPTHGGGWRKNRTPVVFGQDLDLGRFINSTASLKYRLIAVVHQQGRLAVGRYKAVTKAPGGKWEEVQDMAVRKVRVGAALRPAAPWLPFVLVYTRVDGQVSLR